LGTIGDFGCFSFFPTKNLGAAGDGGLITCKDSTAYEKIKILRVHGASKKYHHDILGVNSRLDALQAAVLDVKLKYLDSWNTRRAEIASSYNRELSRFVKTPFVIKDAKHVYHQYAITTERRDSLFNHLNENGIGTAITYPIPLHLQKCFEYLGYKNGDLPVAEKICKQILSLPVYPEMDDEKINYVIDKVKDFFSS
jgi:dTDP-4-amino-4,6-dideoxygalactose transaminase